VLASLRLFAKEVIPSMTRGERADASKAAERARADAVALERAGIARG
jgi:hypothetical protein